MLPVFRWAKICLALCHFPSEGGAASNVMAGVRKSVPTVRKSVPTMRKSVPTVQKTNTECYNTLSPLSCIDLWSFKRAWVCITSKGRRWQEGPIAALCTRATPAGPSYIFPGTSRPKPHIYHTYGLLDTGAHTSPIVRSVQCYRFGDRLAYVLR